MDSIRLPARLESIAEARTFIQKKMSGWNLDARLAGRVELALEEVLVNISRYAYPNYEGKVEILFGLGDESQVYLEIHDWGIPFNPLNHDRPDPDQNLSSRRVGGWGVVLIQEMADYLNYTRAQGRNILSLEFIPRETKLPEPREPEPIR
jgi:anti-sigma regulatory factor (Ser/Thr protein kinase)